MKPQLLANPKNKVQHGPATLSEMSCLMVPFYAITYSGEISTELCSHARRTSLLLYEDGEKCMINDLDY